MELNKLPIIVIFIILSGCCKDEVVNSNRFNEFEKSLIPYTSSQVLSFTDNEENILIANIQRKERKLDIDRPGPESCDLFEYEQETLYLVFQNLNINFSVKFELTALNETSFELITRSESSNLNGRFYLGCQALYDLSIEERITDLSIDQFNFQDVLIFQNCSNSAEIERIIYSPLRGIEFIEFTNGKWWKLNE